MSQSYTASDIEVLSGLEPVRRRPGMYTHTSRPNHLAHEVIDNSVDEALAGHCKQIDVTLYKDGSLQVADDGRGMPVDIHPKEKVSGVELILTRLHAGGKFSDKTYKFSGGLHGVGVSVVNALSKHLECWIKRGGKEYNISFKDGKVASKLEVVGTVGQRNTGTTVRFWPDPKFFDSRQVLRPAAQAHPEGQGRAVPGAARSPSRTRRRGEKDEWFYTGDLGAYLLEELGKNERAAGRADHRHARAATTTRSTTRCAGRRTPRTALGESYVNLIPTIEGGTHVNGLRSGVAQAVREFCEFRNLVPRGIKLTPEDVWDKASYVLSVKIHEPQFAGQMKERLASRDAAPLVEGFVRDSMALWLNRHPGCGRADRAVRDRQRAGARQGRAAAWCASASPAGPALPGKLADCASQEPKRSRAVPGRGRLRRRLRQAGARQGLPGHHAAARQDPEHLGARSGRDRLVARKCTTSASRSASIRARSDLVQLRYHKICILADADSDGQHIATLLCALFLRHFRPLVAQRPRVRRHAAAVPHRCRQAGATTRSMTPSAISC